MAIKTINRTVMVVTPKKPYIDWANSFDNGGVELDCNATTLSKQENFGLSLGGWALVGL